MTSVLIPCRCNPVTPNALIYSKMFKMEPNNMYQVYKRKILTSTRHLFRPDNKEMKLMKFLRWVTVLNSDIPSSCHPMPLQN